jgi:hypothetical protein
MSGKMLEAYHLRSICKSLTVFGRSGFYPSIKMMKREKCDCGNCTDIEKYFTIISLAIESEI